MRDRVSQRAHPWLRVLVLWALGVTLPQLSSAQGDFAIGSPDNPFSNTCDGRAIGFVGPTGERPRMEFKNAPAGAKFSCRTAGLAEIDQVAFGSCDKGDGTQPVHVPDFTAEGTYRTEVRYELSGVPGVTQQITYYVHHSLDRVACCQATQPDEAWFAAARRSLQPAGTFDRTTSLVNPFVTIAARTQAGDQVENILSLRRSFRLSQDGTMILIRRTMASRRTLEATQTNSCVGLAISVPTIGRDPAKAPACPAYKESAFHSDLLDSSCPDVYCTVTSCRAFGDGCIQVSYNFNRGPGQEPWVVSRPMRCVDPSILKFTDYRCDVYVLNRAGQGVCLSGEGGVIREVTKVASATEPLGLAILAAQRGGNGNDRYVFSAKTRRQPGIDNVLYLPP